MYEKLRELTEVLKAADMKVVELLREREQWFRECQVGIPIPLGDDYVFTKINHKWRFWHVESERPVGDMPRNARFEFMKLWDKDKLVLAAEDVVQNAIEGRESVVNDG